MSMDLLERYLQAVGQYLPAATKDDTIAELRANLLEQMDAREEELGRPLVESDVAEILKAHGKPEAVALRYLPQQSLIGPTIYPFYVFTLQRVLPLVIFVCAIAQGILFVSTAHASLAKAMLQFCASVVDSTLITAAIVTAIFAGIELAQRHGHLRDEFTTWDPAKLPPIKTASNESLVKPLWKRVIDLTFHCVWIAYVLWLPSHPFWVLGPGAFYLVKIGIGFAPVWHTFYALLLALLLTQLLMKLLAFSRSVQPWLKPMELATHLLGLVAIGILASASGYFVAVGAGADPHQLAVVNQMVGLSLRIAFVFSLVGVAKDAWQYMKRAKPMKQFAF
jgi:hypothetical protein